MNYPRFLRPPIRVTVELAEFGRGTLVLSFKPMGPNGQLAGTFAVNISPRNGPDDATKMSAAWRPNEDGKAGEWMNLLEQGVQPGRPIRRGFRLPAGSVTGEHRIPLEIGVAGPESV